jgi:hypothetical protein
VNIKLLKMIAKTTLEQVDMEYSDPNDISVNQSVDVSDGIKKKANIFVIQNVNMGNSYELKDEPEIKITDKHAEALWELISTFGGCRLEELEELVLFLALTKFKSQRKAANWLGITARVINYKIANSELLRQFSTRRLEE